MTNQTYQAASKKVMRKASLFGSGTGPSDSEPEDNERFSGLARDEPPLRGFCFDRRLLLRAVFLLLLGRPGVPAAAHGVVKVAALNAAAQQSVEVRRRRGEAAPLLRPPSSDAPCARGRSWWRSLFFVREELSPSNGA